MSYDQMVIKKKEPEAAYYYVIIFDESHLLKDGKAKRTQAALLLPRKASKVIFLSGTPAVSRPAELSQIRLVNERRLSNFHQLVICYCDGEQGRFCFERGIDRHPVQEGNDPLILRSKSQVLTDLSDKSREVVYLSGDKIDARMSSVQEDIIDD